NYRKYESLLVYGGTNYVSELNIQFFEDGKWTDWMIQRPYPYKRKVNIKTNSVVDVSKGNLIVFDKLGDETEVVSIIGGAEGQEIIILSALNTGITIKHT